MNTPHLTPAKLLGASRLPPKWQAARTAFICFTPFPNGFAPYVVATAPERYFLHSPNSEVRLCRFEEHSFLVISEVYGFAVGSTTVEEVVHHGIKQIIGIGYAGAFNGAPLGQRFLAQDTMSDLPLAHHYGVGAMTHCGPTGNLTAIVEECIAEAEQEWGHYTVWNGNSLYREYPAVVAQMRQNGCDIVNMDALSVYAVAPVCGPDVSCVYVGTITDAAEDDSDDWQSDLLEAVERKDVHPHDELINFMVETVLMKL